jgi:drug/metabolite transporter (DMT)-like permease
MMRNLSLLVIAALQVWQQGIALSQVFSYGKKGTLLFRCLSGQACFFLINLSLTMLPVFVYTVLFQTSSFWISLMGFFINREKIIPFELVGMVVCFVCVAAISQAGASGDVLMEEGTEPGTSLAGVFAALSASFVYASSCISNRPLGDLPYQLIMWWGSLIGLSIWIAVYSADLLAHGGTLTLLSHSSETYWTLLGALTFDVLATNAMTIAFQSGASGFVCLIGYVAIVYAFLADLIIFESTFSAVEVIASVTIVATVIVITLYKLGLAKKAAALPV